MKIRLPVLVERHLGDTRAAQTQAAHTFDESLHRDAETVSCRKGCAHCCHHPFLITISEAILLYRHLAEQGDWTPAIRQRLERTRDQVLSLSVEVWLLSHIPCPLLEHNVCAAYAGRPLHCRLTYSLGDPADCHPHRLNANTLLVDSTKEIVAFNREVQEGLRKRRGAIVLMPLSEALLLAEQVESGTLAFEDVAGQYLKDLHRA